MNPRELCSHDFHPFQAFDDMVNNARSLCKLTLGEGGKIFQRDSLGVTASTSAVREHTGLQDFRLIDWSRTMEGTALDPVLRTLPACPASELLSS
jgi:hypothetical protein